MCRPSGVWIGVMEEESTESEHLPSIAVSSTVASISRHLWLA
jgi:hypothetical protein